MSMKKGPFTDDRMAPLNDQGKLVRVKSVFDIDWSIPLWEQLAPVLKGGPNPSTPYDKLRLFPADNVITAMQKSHVSTRYICVKLQHGSSMRHTGSAS